MDYSFSYSNMMKKFMKKPGNLFLQLFLMLSICFFTALGFSLYTSPSRDIDAMKANAVAFDSGITSANTGEASNTNPSNTGSGYSQISVQYLSEAYAANGDDTILYCIAFDANYNPYIVAIPADEMPIYQELMVFSKSDLSVESTNMPAPIPVTGVPEKISEDMAALSTAALNELLGQQVTDNTHYAEVFGAYFLNSATEPSVSTFPFVACLFIASLAAIFLVKTIILQYKYKQDVLKIMDMFSDRELRMIEEEINQPSTVRRYENIYMTTNYLMSRARGVSIIPFKDIVNVNSRSAFSISNLLFSLLRRFIIIQKDQFVTVITRDGVKHEIAKIPADISENSLHNTILRNARASLRATKTGLSPSDHLDEAVEDAAASAAADE